MKIKFDKELGLKNLREQNKIPNDELSILHFNDYYDGPLEGLCRWRDEKYYFLWTGEMSDDEIVRRYFVFRLMHDQLEKEERNHNLFEEAKKQNKLEEFYKIPDEESVFDLAQLVGWTENLPHQTNSVL